MLGRHVCGLCVTHSVRDGRDRARRTVTSALRAPWSPSLAPLWQGSDARPAEQDRLGTCARV